MDLTLNGIPVTVDQIAAQEIVRRHLLGAQTRQLEQFEEAGAISARITNIAPNAGEKIIGSYAGPDGRTTVAILLPGEASDLNWKDALKWAADRGGDLPNRIEALLLFQHHRDEFQREVYWTNEQFAGIDAFAWFQSFNYGGQDGWHEDYKGMARAVRRVAI